MNKPRNSCAQIFFKTLYCLSKNPILYGNLLYEMGQDFLDMQYTDHLPQILRKGH